MLRLPEIETAIFRLGVFLMSVVMFGDYVFRKIWAILGPLFR
jgi:hypothetical protein